MNRRLGIGISGASVLAVLVLTQLSTPVLASPAPLPGVAALDWAFTFASTLDVDPTDKGKAQQWTVMDYPELGALDLALERATSVEGWRRGVVYADLAAKLAREGRKDQARELIGKAQQVRRETSGWQAPRIEAHVAQALAQLGEVGPAQEITARLAAADARQYLGRQAATMAAARGAHESFDAAMEVLREVGTAEDLDTVWWRTMGYLELARHPGFEDGERRRALAATKESAAAIGGWKQAEVLTWLAREWLERDREQARALVDEAEAMILALPDVAPARGPMLAEIAAIWAELEDRKRAGELLELALAAAPRAMPIEQPDIYGRIAASYLNVGEPARARELFDRAMTLAGNLVNSRPRVLALNSILRSMAKARFELDEKTRAQLVALKNGLGDPW